MTEPGKMLAHPSSVTTFVSTGADVSPSGRRSRSPLHIFRKRLMSAPEQHAAPADLRSLLGDLEDFHGREAVTNALRTDDSAELTALLGEMADARAWTAVTLARTRRLQRWSVSADEKALTAWRGGAADVHKLRGTASLGGDEWCFTLTRAADGGETIEWEGPGTALHFVDDVPSPSTCEVFQRVPLEQPKSVAPRDRRIARPARRRAHDLAASGGAKLSGKGRDIPLEYGPYMSWKGSWCLAVNLIQRDGGLRVDVAEARPDATEEPLLVQAFGPFGKSTDAHLLHLGGSPDRGRWVRLWDEVEERDTKWVVRGGGVNVPASSNLTDFYEVVIRSRTAEERTEAGLAAESGNGAVWFQAKGHRQETCLVIDPRGTTGMAWEGEELGKQISDPDVGSLTGDDGIARAKASAALEEHITKNYLGLSEWAEREVGSDRSKGADDFLSDAFCALARNLGQAVKKCGRVDETYFWRRLHQVANDYRDRSDVANRVEVEDAEEILNARGEVPDSLAPHYGIELAELRVKVLAALSLLNDSQRSTIEQFYFEGLSLIEIGALQRRSLAAVKNTLLRARKNLGQSPALKKLQEG